MSLNENALEIDRLLAIVSSATYTGGTYTGTMLVGKAVPMLSAAGWYVGRVCIEVMKQGKDGTPYWYPQPYTRETEYFPTKEGAIAYLVAFYESDEIGVHSA